MAQVNWINPNQWINVDPGSVWRDQDGNAYTTVNGQAMPIETRGGGMMDAAQPTYGYMGDQRTALDLPNIQSIMELPLAPNEGRGGVVNFGNGPRVDWSGLGDAAQAWRALPAPEMGQGWMQGAQWSPDRNRWERMYAAPQMGDTFLDQIAPGLALAGVAGITGAGLMGLGGAGGAGAATTGAGAAGAAVPAWAPSLAGTTFSVGAIGPAELASLAAAGFTPAEIAALGSGVAGLGALPGAGMAFGGESATLPGWAPSQAGHVFDVGAIGPAEMEMLTAAGYTPAEIEALGAGALDLGAVAGAGGEIPQWAPSQAGRTFNTNMPFDAQVAEAGTLSHEGLTAAEMQQLGVNALPAQIGSVLPNNMTTSKVLGNLDTLSKANTVKNALGALGSIVAKPQAVSLDGRGTVGRGTQAYNDATTQELDVNPNEYYDDSYQTSVRFGQTGRQQSARAADGISSISATPRASGAVSAGAGARPGRSTQRLNVTGIPQVRPGAGY